MPVRRIENAKPHARGRLLRLLMLAAVVGVCCLAAQRARADAPLLSSRRTFFIPFTVDMQRQGESAPQEVQLFVSADEGQSWHFYQRQTPEVGRFVFNAGQDGEHWFAVQTIEDASVVVDTQNLQPELKVLIDTVQPELELSLEKSPEGDIVVRWQSSDSALDPVTFRLEYKSAATPLWQPINVARPTAPRGTYSGQHRWHPLPSQHAIQVRAEISDRCGNVTTAGRELQWAAPAAPGPGELPGQPVTPTPLPQVLSTPPVPQAGGSAWPAESTEVPPVAHQPANHAWTAPPEPNGFQPVAQSNPHLPPTPSMSSAPPTPTPDLSDFASQYPSTSHPDANALPFDVRDCNSHRFEFDYVVETQIDVGLEKVELWYTQDQGHSWTLYGEDSDKESPFLVEMNEDGLFGYKIVAQSKHGVTTGPPKPGVAADIWIRIDATPPTGRITTAKFGRGKSLGALQIYWDSHDDFLLPQPVTLLYGETQAGPWRVIADGLPAQGEYDWHVGSNVPAEIYLRLEVRDQAGNITDDTLRDPIASNGLAPQSKIRGIRPAQ